MSRMKLMMIALALVLMLAGSIPVLTAMAAPIAQEGTKDNANTDTPEDAEGDAENAERTADDADAEENIELNTFGLSTTLVQPGRAIVHSRGNHFVVDSPPVLGGSNEERNPVDLLLGVLATCGLFIYESGAAELEMPLESLSVAVEGDLAFQGLKDGSVNPRMREFRVMIDAQGLSDDDFEVLHERWKIRCPVYTTLIRSAPIEVIRVNHDVDDSAEQEAAEEQQEADDQGASDGDKDDAATDADDDDDKG